MLNDANSYYLLCDAGERVVLVHGVRHEIISFLQRSVLDTRIDSVAKPRWEVIKVPVEQPGFFKIERDIAGIASCRQLEEVSWRVKEKARIARLFSEGYSHLLWYANKVTESAWSSATINLADLPLSDTSRQQMAEIFAKCREISVEQALKQISFDEQNLTEILMRRRELIWTFERSLVKVTSRQELLDWKAAVAEGCVRAGSI